MRDWTMRPVSDEERGISTGHGTQPKRCLAPTMWLGAVESKLGEVPGEVQKHPVAEQTGLPEPRVWPVLPVFLRTLKAHETRMIVVAAAAGPVMAVSVHGLLRLNLINLLGVLRKFKGGGRVTRYGRAAPRI